MALLIEPEGSYVPQISKMVMKKIVIRNKAARGKVVGHAMLAAWLRITHAAYCAVRTSPHYAIVRDRAIPTIEEAAVETCEL